MSTPTLSSLRAELRTRQAARAARNALARDLAGYSSEAQITEMEAILSRYDDAESADVAAIAAMRTVVLQARTAA